MNPPQACAIVGEVETGHLQETRDRHIALRNRAIAELRLRPAANSRELASRLGCGAKTIGRVLGLFPRYFIFDDGDKTCGITNISLHPHLQEQVA